MIRNEFIEVYQSMESLIESVMESKPEKTRCLNTSLNTDKNEIEQVDRINFLDFKGESWAPPPKKTRSLDCFRVISSHLHNLSLQGATLKNCCYFCVEIWNEPNKWDKCPYQQQIPLRLNHKDFNFRKKFFGRFFFSSAAVSPLIRYYYGCLENVYGIQCDYQN